MMISDTNKSKLRNKKINSKLQKKEKDELVLIHVFLPQSPDPTYIEKMMNIQGVWRQNPYFQTPKK